MIKHLLKQPFILATGIAALIHSTWSLATMMDGLEPAQLSLQWFGWLIPALLIAFALDIGQMATSFEIREGQRTKAKYGTFFVFAGATYYLQFIFMMAHMPQVQLDPGVRESWSGGVQFARDLALIVIPALMPLSTLLYTFSYGKAAIPDPQPEVTELPVVHPIIRAEPDVAPVMLEAIATPEPDVALERHLVCPDCGKDFGTYTDPKVAAQKLNGHKSHCPKKRQSQPVQNVLEVVE